MKANRKFKSNDDAVSPVIATILMVAITVVLAATVYVWVSGFGSTNSHASRAITLSGDAPLTADGHKSFTVSAASTNLRWEDLIITLDGQRLTQNGANSTVCTTPTTGQFSACNGPVTKGSTEVLFAGDQLRVTAAAGQTLRILDIEANAVLFTVTIG